MLAHHRTPDQALRNSITTASDDVLDATVDALARPVAVVSHDITVKELETRFWAHPEWTSVVVEWPDGKVALLSRVHFMATMSGRTGFGRGRQARQARRAIGWVAPLETLVVEPAAQLAEVGERAIARPSERRHEDVVVRYPDWYRIVSVAEVFSGLSKITSHQALHDALTGLGNRRLFHEALDDLTGLGRNRAWAVVFVDLDDFKTVNDSLGHEAGDELLRVCAGRLRRAVRDGDIVARLGGDEFAVVLLDTTADEAEGVAARIVAELGRTVPLGDDEIAISASAGIVTNAAEVADAETVLRNADLAMYHAKAAGKGRYAVFHEELHDQALNRLHIKTDLPGALERNELALVFQPIYALDDGRVAAIEALLRWRSPHHPDGVPPSEFVPIAEQTGLIGRFGAWVLDHACRQLAQWHTTHPDLRLHVNLSPRQLEDRRLAKQVKDVLDGHGVPASTLVLELTENSPVEQANDGTETLLALREIGVHVAVDHFGRGYSSLSRLLHTPIDILKFDGALIEDLASDGRDLEVAKSVLSMAHAMEVVSVAEGIETAVQLDRLRAIGCPFGQGYFLSRPVHADEITKLLASQRTDAAVTATA